MVARMSFKDAAPNAVRAMLGIAFAARESGIEPELQELICVRASQLNGCAYCVDIHTQEARAAGETEQRLYALPVWREAPFFTERERAALNWTEHVTLIAQDHVPDEVYEDVRRQFSEAEVANLTLVIAAINVTNRISVSFRQEAGHYTPGQFGHGH
jgi:AhpD family alkylhydroperoxidase